MVEPQHLITPEIAERYDMSIHTVTKSWSAHPAWPAPVDRRGRYKEYAAEDVSAFVRDHVDRQAVTLEPRRLYTAQQLEDAGIGIKASTIRADLSRSRKPDQPRRWPEPDDTSDGVNCWTGETVTTALTTRRGYRKNA
ncbi:hypothetical protein [Streptomyces sp. Tu 4128]|uniref:hypothetical protein n=1 Tax=Streptomyces sp. Tu 4128 TaxID=1120314 RepID=UPI000F03861F|nr:hypothetical protein [Streptomyces sp. Tu 4128]